jgi:hypothetical protein
MSTDTRTDPPESDGAATLTTAINRRRLLQGAAAGVAWVR